MYSHREYKQLDIKQEGEELSVINVKPEPQDVQCEMTTEEEKSFHIDVKQEILPSEVVASIYTKSEAEDTKNMLSTLLEDYENKSEDQQKNTEETSENFYINLKDEHCNKKVYDHTEVKTFIQNMCEYDCVAKNKSLQTADKVVTCDPCDEQVSQVHEFTKCMHIETSEKTMSGNICSRFSHTIDRSGQIYNERIGKSFWCTICNKSFSRKSNFNIHMRVHSGEKPFTCAICGNSYSLNSTLTKHMLIHAGENVYTCNICGKSHCHKGSLIAHIRSHTGEKPYTCNLCGKSFSHNSTLITHRNTHSDKKPYSCNICRRSFSRKSNLSDHMRRHGPIKPFKCEMCSSSFFGKCELDRHRISHTGEKPYTCNMCAKSFSKRNELTEHMGIHTGIEPFKCNFCNKCFFAKSKFNRHARTHEKPFSCNNCNKSFSDKCNLIKHLATHCC